MNCLYVRVNPKSGNTQFYRCAMFFTLAWTFVTVDDATADRLMSEQMLEVSQNTPADYVEPAAEPAAEPAGEPAAANVTPIGKGKK